MDLHIDKIFADLYAAEDVTRKFRKAIEALQNICDHDMETQGHGHNETYYVCSKCGKKETDR